MFASGEAGGGAPPPSYGALPLSTSPPPFIFPGSAPAIKGYYMHAWKW